MSQAITDLARNRYVSLTTFTRDGVPKPTAMWFVAEGDELLMTTGADSWKVKRIRRSPRVTLAPCTARGTVTGETVEATAVIVDDAATVDRIRGLVVQRYGIFGRIVAALNTRRAGPRAGISITLGAPESQ